jgi:spermidine dehydrogenase
MMLPHVASDLAQDQRAALSHGVKAPLVYVKIAVRNWRAWVRAGVHEVTNTTGFYSRLKLDYPVSIGGYRFAQSPDEPTVVHLVHVPLESGVDQRAAWRGGRARLQQTTFQEFESRAYDELGRILGSAFDPKRDVTAISVYRWAHGYAYGFNSLFDKEEILSLQSVARRPVGRIAIANSDAAWSAYAHAAIDEAARAVSELAD